MKDQKLTLQFAYQEGLGYLKQAGCENPAFDTICLLEKNFHAGRSRLAIAGNLPVAATAYQAFLHDIHRRVQGVPLQYILGEWEFMGLPFCVGEGVLIPRPDTETLVEAGLACLEGVQSPVIADLCAGSGCVGISFAHFRPQANVYLLEISREARPYLLDNIRRNQAGNVRLLAGDILNGPGDFPELPLCHAVFSNPPYIPSGELPRLQKEVQAEPALALDGGEDGLRFYRAIASLWPRQLLPGGYLGVECGFDQAEQVERLFWDSGLQNVHSVLDLSGVARVVFGQKPETPCG